MPVEWITPPDTPDAPRAELHLWPYRSLLRRDFVIFIAGTATLVTLPLLAVIGSPVLWALLPFLAAMIAGVWLALNRSYRDGELLEELRIWDDRATLTRHTPRKPTQTWEANPHWIRVELHEGGGPVPFYLTLKGGPREVEIGAFLSEDERRALYGDLRRAFTNP
ncbi:MAG: hypothetical protein COB65_13165 [Thalassobium sp.]|nr:MAG: hypothetical protein COB65_13165 [Thalassobium sp.]